MSNLGDDPNWTGHEFSAANTYGYGRLAWDPTLSAEQVTREWVEATWGTDPTVVSGVTGLLLGSWATYVACSSTPLRAAPQFSRATAARC